MLFRYAKIRRTHNEQNTSHFNRTFHRFPFAQAAPQTLDVYTMIHLVLIGGRTKSKSSF